jgi:hypothetical protein
MRASTRRAPLGVPRVPWRAAEEHVVSTYCKPSSASYSSPRAPWSGCTSSMSTSCPRSSEDRCGIIFMSAGNGRRDDPVRSHKTWAAKPAFGPRDATPRPLEVRVDQVRIQHDQHVWEAHMLGEERCRYRGSRLRHATEFPRCRLHGFVWDHELHVQVRVDIGLHRGERAPINMPRRFGSPMAFRQTFSSLRR